VMDGRYSPYRKRRHGRPPDGLNGHRFLAYFQNHDQIGNRAQGDRASRLVSPGRLKIASALVLTSPFVPMLFQGEEWGATTPFLYFTDYDEPTLANNVRAGRCKEFEAFGWKREEIPDPQDRSTFERSKLDWAEVTNEPHRELLEWYRCLIKLRREEPSLSDGRRDRVGTRHDEVQRWLAVERGPITIACNLAGDAQSIPLPEGARTVLLASEPVEKLKHDRIVLRPDSVAILKARS